MRSTVMARGEALIRKGRWADLRCLCKQNFRFVPAKQWAKFFAQLQKLHAFGRVDRAVKLWHVLDNHSNVAEGIKVAIIWATLLLFVGGAVGGVLYLLTSVF